MKNQWNWEIRMPVSVLQEYMKGENIKMDLSKAILWYKRGYERGMPIVHAIWLHAIIKEKV